MNSLFWWKSLTLEQQKEVHAHSKHKHYSFQMFSASTHAIRSAWAEKQRLIAKKPTR